MDKIWTDLLDPSWWFTAFFIAVIASIIAAYAKDVINALLSATSKRYKRWYEKVRARELKEIEQVANNPPLLIILFGETLFALVEIVLCMVVYVFLSVSATQSTILTFLSQRPPTPLVSYTSAALMMVPISIYFSYLLGTRFRKFRKAYKSHLRRNSSAALGT
jgi:hypothetical protein